MSAENSAPASSVAASSAAASSGSAGAVGEGQSPQERELAGLIVQALNLEDVDAGSLAPETPLFLIEDGGLGLDSIDALEIALAINEHYGVEIRVGEDGSDEEALRAIFRCVRTLSNHIAAERAAGRAAG